MRQRSFFRWMVPILVFIELFTFHTLAWAAPDRNAVEALPPWAQKEIQSLMADGIVQGYEDGSYRPNQQVTRAELVAMIRRAAKSLTISDSALSIRFNDVHDEWFAEDVNFAARKGWIQGFEDGTFRPNAPVKRQESAVILNHILQLNAQNALSFRDASSIPAWAASAVAALSEAGILSGYADGKFQGESTLTRAEAAVLLYRVREKIEERGSHPLTLQVKAEGGSALADAYVSLHEKGKRSLLQWGHTDATGKAIFKIPYGAYEIAMQKKGAAAHQAIEFNKEATTFQLQAEPAAEFRGRLIGENGKPAAGVFVTFTTNPTFLAQTDADGVFHAFVLPDWQYRMSVVEITSQNGNPFFDGSVPPGLAQLDELTADSVKCLCRQQTLQRELKAPQSGGAVDLGNFFLSDINQAPSSGGSGQGTGGGVTVPPSDTTAPAVPAGLSAIPMIGAVKLNWNGVGDSDLGGYKLYTSTDGGLTWGTAVTVGNATDYTVTQLTYGTMYTFSVSAYDIQNNESTRSASVSAMPLPLSEPDTTPPAIPTGVAAVAAVGGVTLHWAAVPDPDLDGYRVYLSENQGVSWSAIPKTIHDTQYTVTQLVYGVEYHFAVTALDLSGNESAKSSVVGATTLPGEDNNPPSVPTGLKATAGNGQVALVWDAAGDTDLAGYKVYKSTDGVAWDSGTDVGHLTAYSVTGLPYGATYWFAVSAYDAASNESAKSEVAQATVLGSPESLPPDPAEIATAIPKDGSATFASTVAFLYEGSRPIQTDVAPGALVPERVAVLRGVVRDDADQPLSGVTVSILDHDSWGRTLTRADGMFDLAVNGGGVLTVKYEKNGYMPIERKINAPWSDFANLPDVMMKAYDSQVTTVTFTGQPGEFQVARGSKTTDADGTRQATLLIPGGATASLKLPDGTVQPVASLNIRATEYTVGDKGEQAMPGELPALVGYTYAVELSADEAVAAGATEVRFNKPLYMYVDNFLNFPVGGVVPVGYYDRHAGAWVPSDNGKIIQIVSMDGGIAAVDIDGDGLADDENKLASIGLTQEERSKLASLYVPGKTLWRVPIEHFTPWDCNWPYGPPPDAIGPPNRGPKSNKPKVNGDCNQPGSIIGCQEQTLKETVPVTGTNLNLNYSSRRAEGYADKSTLDIPVSDGNLPASLRGIQVEVEVAGTREVRSVSLDQRSFVYRWDGLDSFNRKLYGTYSYRVTVKYLYTPQYYSSSDNFGRSFGQAAGATVIGDRESSTISFEREWYGTIMSPFDFYQDSAIAGWSLDAQYYYDQAAGTVYKGDGTVVHRMKDALVPKEISLRPTPQEPDIGITQNNSYLNNTGHNIALDVGADGALYLNTYKFEYGIPPRADILRIDREGHAKLLASKSGLRQYTSLTVDADGTMYASSWDFPQIWRKRVTDNDWVVIAGTGIRREQYATNQDGMPAVDVKLYDPHSLQATPDGSLYFIDDYSLCRITPDGRIYRYGEDGKPSEKRTAGVESGKVSKVTVGVVYDLAMGPDGSLYVTDRGGCFSNSYGCEFSRIRKISQDGTISLVAGSSSRQPAPFYDGIKAVGATFHIWEHHIEIDRSGNIFFIGEPASSPIRRLYKVNPQGFIVEMAGDVMDQLRKRVKEAGGDSFGEVNMYIKSVGPDGELLLVVDDYKATPDYVHMYRLHLSGRTQVPDESGMLLYEFDPKSGRHLRTVNALTGGLIYELGYDGDGRLTSLTDRDGNAVKVERDSQGTPTAIVAPGGQRTALTVEQGRLTAITNPANETYRMEYQANGLLKTFIDPNQRIRRYGYDDSGYLTSAENPLEGVSTLSRQTLDDGYRVTFVNPDHETTIYEVRLVNGELRRISTDPTGAQIASVRREDGSEDITYPDGTKAAKRLAPDPRWGWDAPIVAQLTVTSPQGRSWNLQENRQVKLEVEGLPLTLQTMTVTYTLSETSGNGTTTQVSTLQFDAAQKKFTETSAESEVTLMYLNEKDRVDRIEESGQSIDPLVFSYDTKGRLAEIQRGEQFIIRTYDGKNRVLQITDASGNTMKYQYDDTDRVIGITLPSGKTVGKEYDDAGNLAAIVMPDQTVYRQSVNGLDLFNGFTLNGAASGLAVMYTTGGKIDKTILPGGREIDYQYDSAGRVGGMNDAEILRTFTYAGNTDLVGKMESTVLSNPAQKQAIDFAYDGSDVTEMTWTGSANGKFTYTYDGFSGLKNIRATINGESMDTPVSWDKEHQLTKFGPFSFNRSGPGRRVDSINDGTMDAALTYDRQGRVESMTYRIGGDSVYKLEYGYDERGRVIRKTITAPEGTVTDTYQYDADGQLTILTRIGDSGGAYQEAYTYDDNRNRKTRAVTGSSAETSLYGSNDTLSMVGATDYQFDDDGYLINRGQDTFHYGPRGELLEATVGGSKVSYVYDALGRRTAREAGGQKTQYLYGNPESPFLLTDTVDTNNGASVTTHYFYNEEGLLLAFERGNTRYYVVTDGVGTPQRILKADKTKVKELRYDSFGVPLSDSAPDFKLAIGFAGGIADETTGFVRFGFRDYDPYSGRWTARDPILFDAGQANLYAYVNNNPVQLRDACGLFCVGASAYDGLGGGGKFCITDKGVSACAEAGVGFGEGLEINPFEDLSKNEISAELTGKVSAGPASATAGVKASSRFNGDCFDLSPVSKFELGPFGYDFVTPSESGMTGEFNKLNTDVRSSFKGAEIKAQAALKTKICGQYKW